MTLSAQYKDQDLQKVVDAFSEYYNTYTANRLKPVLTVGYSYRNKETDPKKRYKKAKAPFVEGFTNDDYIPPSLEGCITWIKKGGWIGWVIPKGVVVLDVEDEDAIQYIKAICKQKGIQPAIHRTNNGVHFFFKCNDNIPADSKAITRAGIPVTYRIGGKNQLILAPINNRSWEVGLTDTQPEIPEELKPYNRKNKTDVLKALSWAVGDAIKNSSLHGYDDIDTSYMAFLIENGYSCAEIDDAFQLAFRHDYDDQKTEQMYQRAKDRLNGGDSVRGAGSFIQQINEQGLENIKSFVRQVTGYKTEVKREITKENGIVSQATEVTEVTVFPLIEFPLDVFPADIQKTIKKISASFHVQDEVIACCMLPIVSSAIGNTIKISPREGWVVPVFIWLILIALTGYGKSRIISILMKEIEKMQGKAYQDYKAELKEYKRLLRQSKDSSDIDVPDKPSLKHYLVSDFTIEALSGIFHDDPRGVVACIDEIAGLINGLNQYKGKGNDRQHILNLWNAASWMIDRKSGAMFIPNTGSSIIGGIQPRVIPQVFSLDSFDDGLLPRFLFYQATSGKNRFSRQSITENDLHNWNKLIRHCHSIVLDMETNCFAKATTLKLNGNALGRFESFYNEYMALEPFLTDRARAFIPKLITYCLKFAGVLHVMQSYSDGISINRLIDSNTMNNAIKLTRFFTGQAIRILKLYDPEEPKYNEYEKRLIKSLYSLQGEVKKAKLPLSRVVDTFNADLPEKLQHTPEKVRSLLSGLNINAEKSTHNLSYLIWEADVLKSLFLQNTVTSVTTVTTKPLEDEIEDKKVTEVTDVTVERKKQTLLEDDDNVLDLTGYFGGAE